MFVSQMLDEHLAGKHSGAAQGMTMEDLVTRLANLGEVFQQWRNSGRLQQQQDEGGLELLGVR